MYMRMYTVAYIRRREEEQEAYVINNMNETVV